MALARCLFTLSADDDTKVYAGLTDGTTWNGFANVRMTAIICNKVVADLIAANDDANVIAEMANMPKGPMGLIDFSNGWAFELIACECEGDDCTARHAGGSTCTANATQIVYGENGEVVCYFCDACSDEYTCGHVVGDTACGYDCPAFEGR
jgi:hypothetical protein